MRPLPLIYRHAKAVAYYNGVPIHTLPAGSPYDMVTFYE